MTSSPVALYYFSVIFVVFYISSADDTPYKVPGIPGVFYLPDFPPPPMSKSCMINSLSSPFWIVSSFHRSTEGDVEFDLKNAVDGSSAHCEGGATGDCRGRNRGEFEFDFERRSLVVKQHWLCDDLSPGKAREFSGYGGHPMLLRCDDQGCTAPATSIPASLLEPVEITPMIPPPPNGHDSPKCSSRSSQATSWTISDWNWIVEFIPPCSDKSCPSNWSNVSFNVINPITSVTSSCKLELWQVLTGNGYVRQSKSKCIDATHYPNGYNYFTAVNLISWNTSDRTLSLSIAQQWYCDDEGVEKPTQFTQFGMRNITNGTTTGGSFAVASSHIVQHPMEPYALEFPKNVQSCTIDSLTPGKPILRIQDIHGEMGWILVTQTNSTVTHRTGKGAMYTGAHNLAQPDRRYTCEAYGDYLNPNLTYPAYAPEKTPMKCFTTTTDYDPKNAQGELLSLYMSYDNRTNVVTVQNHTWSCWDKDPQYTIVFTSSAAQKIDKTWDCVLSTSSDAWNWDCSILERVRTTNISLEENLQWYVQNKNMSARGGFRGDVYL